MLHVKHSTKTLYNLHPLKYSSTQKCFLKNNPCLRNACLHYFPATIFEICLVLLEITSFKQTNKHTIFLINININKQMENTPLHLYVYIRKRNHQGINYKG